MKNNRQRHMQKMEKDLTWVRKQIGRGMAILLCLCMLAGNTISVYADESVPVADQTSETVSDGQAVSQETGQPDAGAVQTVVDEAPVNAPADEPVLAQDETIQETTSPGDAGGITEELEAAIDNPGAEISGVSEGISQEGMTGDEAAAGQTEETEQEELTSETEDKTVSDISEEEEEKEEIQNTSSTFRAVIMKTEGGEIRFSDTMMLPEKETSDDDNALDIRSFTSGKEIILNAFPEEGNEVLEITAVCRTTG